MSTWRSALVICAFGVFSFCAALAAVCEVGFLQEVCSSLTAPNKLDSAVIFLSVLLIFLGVWAVGLPSDQVRPSSFLLIHSNGFQAISINHNIGVEATSEATSDVIGESDIQKQNSSSCENKTINLTHSPLTDHWCC